MSLLFLHLNFLYNIYFENKSIFRIIFNYVDNFFEQFLKHDYFILIILFNKHDVYFDV